MGEERKKVTIVICGDEGVGKTSLLSRLVSSNFTERVTACSPPITIPEQILAGPESERVAIELIDTLTRKEDDKGMDKHIRSADAVCIVYSVKNAKSRETITSLWLPLMRNVNPNAPVVILANKIDLMTPEEQRRELELMKNTIAEECKEVMYCVACSAKSGQFVDEAFGYAKKAVLFPTRPIFDPTAKEFTPSCVAALKRIFCLIDMDKDGLLDAHELREFQSTCFGKKMSEDNLKSINKTLQARYPEGLGDGGVNERGFLFLMRLFMELSRQDSVWRILRHFGYGDNLELMPSFLVPDLGDLYMKVVGLSQEGYHFLAERFRRFGSSLSESQVKRLFETAPNSTPIWDANYRDQAQTAERNKELTLQGFLSLWSMIILLDYKKAMQYMGYLGFPGKSRTDCITVFDKENTNDRNVFMCYVFGSAGCGKTAILRQLIEKPFLNEHKPTIMPQLAVNAINAKGQYLVMKELGSKENETLSLPSEMRQADVVCLVYDLSDPSSFSHVYEIQKHLLQTYPHLPCVYVATKGDKPPVQQNTKESPSSLCKSLSLDPPIKVSMSMNQTNDIYSRIFDAVVTNKAPKAASSLMVPLVVGAGVVIASAALGGWLILNKRTPWR